jgi:hypothetical protein
MMSDEENDMNHQEDYQPCTGATTTKTTVHYGNDGTDSITTDVDEIRSNATTLVVSHRTTDYYYSLFSCIDRNKREGGGE